MEAVVQRSWQRDSEGRGGEHGVEQLKSALAACEFRLRAAEQARGALEALLVPVEEARAELAAERRRTAEALRENERLFKEGQRCASRITELQEEVEKLLREKKAEEDGVSEKAAERARRAALEGELARAAEREAALGARVQEAMDRANALAVQVVEARAEKSRAQEQLGSALERIQDKVRDRMQEEDALTEKEREIQLLRQEVQDARADAEAARAATAKLQDKHDALQEENALQHGELCQAAEREGAASSRAQIAEAELEALKRTAAAAAAERQRGPPSKSASPPLGASSAAAQPRRAEAEAPQTPRRLEAAEAAGVLALRGPLISEVKQKPAPPSPIDASCPRSRRDYPKGAHGRMARKVVLGIPIDEKLGDDLPRWEAANKERWQRLVLK